MNRRHSFEACYSDELDGNIDSADEDEYEDSKAK
jgi:hypothetical protein